MNAQPAQEAFDKARRAVAHYAAGNSEQSLEVIAKMRAIRDGATLADFLKRNEGKLATTAEEVIERYIEATGGREALNTVKTMIVVLSVQSTRGEQPRLVRMYKRPYFYDKVLRAATNSPQPMENQSGKSVIKVGGKWKESRIHMPGWLVLTTVLLIIPQRESLICLSDWNI